MIFLSTSLPKSWLSVKVEYSDLETFVKVYDDNGIPLQWQKGDIAVVCNYRFAHGRLGYECGPGEKRELGVILGEMYPRLGNREHAW